MNTSRGQTMLATVLRGLRSRALLTVGSVLLTALAIGAAVLGPIFQVAVTNSYYVTRLEEAPNPLTGLTWHYQPATTYDGTPAAARDRAARIVEAREAGPVHRGPAPAGHGPVQRAEGGGPAAGPRGTPAATSRSRAVARPDPTRS